jgi:hypothetical protein
MAVIVRAPRKHVKYQYSPTLAISSLVNGSPYSSTVIGLAQGTDETLRIGDLVKFNWAEFSLNIELNSTLIQVCTVRALLVQETTALGSSVSVSGLFNSTTPVPYEMRNYVTRAAGRYRVLWDSGVLEMGGLSQSNPSGGTGIMVNMFGAPAERTFLNRIPLGFTADYSRGNSGTVTDIDLNNVSLVMITDTSTASWVNATFKWVAQFEDA